MSEIDDSVVAPWIAAVLHEMVQPLSVAQTHVALASERLEVATKALRRSALGAHALGWLVRVLQKDETALGARSPQRIASALDLAAPAEADLAIEVPSHLTVLAAPGALEMVLDNLITNACRHSGGARVKVHASIDSSEAWLHERTAVRLRGHIVRLTVADEGAGFADNQALFEAFSSATPGRGIGLWLCRLIVRAHGGDLWCDPVEQGVSITSAWQCTVPPHPDQWPQDPVELGKALREARTAAHMTRAQLGALAGVADSTIRNIEMARHRCTHLTLGALTEALATGRPGAKWQNPRSKAETNEPESK